jgi:hypothetical protein
MSNPYHTTDSDGVQNFAVSVAEAQISPERLFKNGSPTYIKRTLDLLNIIFTIVFAAELLLNLTSNWIRPFLSNTWSVFDAIIVTMSIIVLGPLDFPPISILRALRVMRLFGRLESSKKILSALSVSIVPMCNAFFINLIVAMICPPLPMPSLKVFLRLMV